MHTCMQNMKSRQFGQFSCADRCRQQGNIPGSFIHTHTCYCLSGLSMAQHFTGNKLAHTCVVGNPNNLLRAVHPVFNLTVDAVALASSHFQHSPLPTSS
ncbi:hypothetical protein ACOMHN_044404 [Nucella lapillus]